MSDTAAHRLSRRINALVDDAAAETAEEINDANREASLVGRSNSGYVLKLKNELVRKRFRATTLEQAKTILRAPDLSADQKVSRLEAAARQLSNRLTGLLNPDYVAADALNHLRLKLRGGPRTGYGFADA